MSGRSSVQSGDGVLRTWMAYAIMAACLIAVGVFQSWAVMLSMTQLCIISAIMALGLNMQWGYAGLFNAGIMGFASLGQNAFRIKCNIRRAHLRRRGRQTNEAVAVRIVKRMGGAIRRRIIRHGQAIPSWRHSPLALSQSSRHPARRLHPPSGGKQLAGLGRLRTGDPAVLPGDRGRPARGRIGSVALRRPSIAAGPPGIIFSTVTTSSSSCSDAPIP